MNFGPFVLVHDVARGRAAEAVRNAPAGYVVKITPPTRSLEQNSRMWAMLGDISRQVVWHGRRLSPESWKCVFSASLKKQDVVPGLHGDFVVIGQHTSRMTVSEISDLMEIMSAFGAEHDVHWAESEVSA